MKKILLITTLFLFCAVPFSFAEKIQLKTGEIITGNVTSLTKNSIVVQTEAGLQTHLLKDVYKVNGKSLFGTGQLISDFAVSIPTSSVSDTNGKKLPLWIMIVLFVFVYAFNCFPMMKIAQRLEMEESWWAWVPILNIFLPFRMAERPLWWALLILVPIVNLILIVIVFLDIVRRRNQPGWHLVFWLLPLTSSFYPYYLAFCKDSKAGAVSDVKATSKDVGPGETPSDDPFKNAPPPSPPDSFQKPTEGSNPSESGYVPPQQDSNDQGNKNS